LHHSAIIAPARSHGAAHFLGHLCGGSVRMGRQEWGLGKPGTGRGFCGQGSSGFSASSPYRAPFGLLFAVSVRWCHCVPWCPCAAWCAASPRWLRRQAPLLPWAWRPSARFAAGRPDLPPRVGKQGNSRHIAWPSASLESLCVITPIIRGVMTHNNEKDHFPACSGEYLRGGRAGDARAGPAGAVRPGRAAGRGRRPAGTTPATGRLRHRAASPGIPASRAPRAPQPLAPASREDINPAPRRDRGSLLPPGG
jgi:hypothetical protein